MTSTALATRLATRTPADTDRVAVSRASQHNVSLTLRHESRFPPGRPSYSIVVGCDVIGLPSEREAALADLRKFQTPATENQIAGWLAELSVISAKRKDSEFDESLRLTAYTHRLMAYPADVVRSALADRTWRYWPTWDELKDVCEELAKPRRMMILALEAPIKDFQPEAKPERIQPDRVKAIMEEVFGEGIPDADPEDVAKVVQEAAKNHG